MKTTYLKVIPLCDICKKEPAAVDVPTTQGSWAYLCQGCRPRYEAPFADKVGTKLQLWRPHEQKVNEVFTKIYGEALLAKELTSSEDAILGRKDRVIQCPSCGQRRNVSMDASGPAACICGQNLIIHDLMEIA